MIVVPITWTDKGHDARQAITLHTPILPMGGSDIYRMGMRKPRIQPLFLNRPVCNRDMNRQGLPACPPSWSDV
jgi:hypothetical protein